MRRQHHKTHVPQWGDQWDRHILYLLGLTYWSNKKTKKFWRDLDKKFELLEAELESKNEST